MYLKIKSKLQTIDNRILLFIVAQFFQYGTSFVTIKLLASKLSVENFGLYNLIITTSFVISMFPFTAFDQILNRKITSLVRNKINLSPYIANYILFLILVHVLFFCLYAILPARLQPLIFIVIYYSITNILKTTLSGVLNFTNDRNGFNVIKIADNLLKLLVVFIFYNRNDIKLIFVFLIVENLFMLLVWGGIYKTFFKNINFKKITPYRKYLILGSIPLLIWAPFELIQNNLYIYFLEYNGYKNDVGFFSFYNSLSLVIPAGIGGILTAYALPEIYSMVKIRTLKEVNKYTFKVLLIYIVSTTVCYILLMLIIRPMIGYLSKAEYLAKIGVFSYLYVANLIFNASIITTNVFFAYKKQQLLIVVKVIPGFVAFFLLFFFTAKYGLDAVKFIFLIVSVIQVLIIYLVYLKLNRIVK